MNQENIPIESECIIETESGDYIPGNPEILPHQMSLQMTLRINLTPNSHISGPGQVFINKNKKLRIKANDS